MSLINLAPTLFDNGYQPIPVDGKRPVLAGWTTANIDRSTVKAWEQSYPTSNIGIRTGQGSIPIFGADFDFYDPGVADTVSKAFIQRFGAAPIRVGQAPKKLLIYRGSKTHPKITSPVWIDSEHPEIKHRFELLGTGQQFVAFGIHPDTGLAYSWAEDDLQSVRAEDLPFLDPAEVSDWIKTELTSLLPASYKTMCSGSAEHSSSSNQEWFDQPITEQVLTDLRSAVDYMTPLLGQDYDTWVNEIGLPLKALELAGHSDVAQDLWHQFSSYSPQYSHEETDRKWSQLTPQRTSFKKIFNLAKQHGWVNPQSKEGKRQQAREQNRIIGEAGQCAPETEVLTLDEMLDRLVFQERGSYVLDKKYPKLALRWQDARAKYSASTSTQTTRRPDGRVVEREVACIDLWKADPRRLSVADRTFVAGGDQFVFNDEGLKCFNIFTPFNRELALSLPDSSKAKPFIDHITWLFADRADEFMDWLAHIEQDPKTLPQTSWLHIATKTGMGRNWLSSVLVRVWAGHVASNYDLVAGLTGRFNGQLSCKLLAQVDELNESQAGTAKWQYAEKLKSVLNAEFRFIDQKYGAQYSEKNACRFLMFSNHISAIPIDKDDRRIQVVVCKEQPKDESYYDSLYKLLNDGEFIAAVARFLMDRDLSHFYPGARAKMTTAKSAVVDNTQSLADELASLLVEASPFDLVPASFLAKCFGNESAAKHVKQRAGIEPYISPTTGKPTAIRIGEDRLRVNVLRNHSHWAEAGIDQAKEEVSNFIAATRHLDHFEYFNTKFVEDIMDWLYDQLEGQSAHSAK